MLREVARSLFDTAVRAADPALGVRNALNAAPLPPIEGGRYILVAAGKAASAMIEEATKHVPAGAEMHAIAVTNYENHRPIANCDAMAAGHPVPDANGIMAGQKVAQLMMTARQTDFVLCLISGGASALMPAPLPGITLGDKIELSELLLAHGFDITEMNLVRQQLSLLKGGGLAKLARPAQIRALIISDVIGDDLRVVASGPTAPPLGSPMDAAELIARRGLWAKVPLNVRERLTEKLSPVAEAEMEVENVVIGSNRDSLRAVAQAPQGWTPQIVTGRLTGDVSDAVGKILLHARHAQPNQRRLLIFGGETTVNIKGSGKGGRNQELALRFALEAQYMRSDWVFLSGGTDGRDGPTDAAGGIVDYRTAARIKDSKLNAEQMLNNNDSYAALKAAGDLLCTGATGTNVADVQLFLIA